MMSDKIKRKKNKKKDLKKTTIIKMSIIFDIKKNKIKYKMMKLKKKLKIIQNEEKPIKTKRILI
jgi:hypothetical protein